MERADARAAGPPRPGTRIVSRTRRHGSRGAAKARDAAARTLAQAASARPLVSVHVRWGDKYREMRLRPISDYVAGVRNVTRNTAGPVDVFLTTEDRRAVDAFREAAPNEWRVLLYEAAVADVAKPAQQARNHTNSGFHSLVSLVLAMQARPPASVDGSRHRRGCHVDIPRGREAFGETTPASADFFPRRRRDPAEYPRGTPRRGRDPPSPRA